MAVTAIEVFKRLKERLESGVMSPDEPVFMLRAQDALAADVVDHWTMKARQMGAPSEKTDESTVIAEKMRAWPVHQLPGRQSSRSPRYST